MLHGKMWNTPETRYLYGSISMKKIIEIFFSKKCIEDGHMARPCEP